MELIRIPGAFGQEPLQSLSCFVLASGLPWGCMGDARRCFVSLGTEEKSLQVQAQRFALRGPMKHMIQLGAVGVQWIRHHAILGHDPVCAFGQSTDYH